VTAGWPLADGETTPDGIVPMDAGYFNYIAQGTGDLYFCVTEPEDVIADGRAAFP
jgi:hypothetical protein